MVQHLSFSSRHRTNPAVRLAAGAIALVVAGLGAPRVAAADTVVAPYGGSTYRFEVMPAQAPVGWQLPGFDDSAWANPKGPVGNANTCGFTVTPIWPINTQGLARLHFTLPSGCTIATLKLGFAIDNDLLEVYLNGTSILAAPFVHENCATLDSLVLTPPASTFQAGDNVLAVHVRDRGGSTVYDHQVSIVTKAGCAAPTAVCDESAKACVACLGDADCGGNKPFCDVGTKTCVECLADAACGNGGKACAVGSCGANHTCGTKPAADGAACADGDACNGAETCKGGACQSGQPLVCNSGSPCLSDSCDPVKGCVATPVADGTSCSDGNACNGAEACLGGGCQSGQPLACNSGNPCLADSCDPVKGCVSKAVANGTSCSDGNACNGAETCFGGACQGGQPLKCSPGGPCLAAACDPKVGCVTTPVKDGTPCLDGDLCNGTESCFGGACFGGKPLDCNDGDACTLDSCTALTGCKHEKDADAGACGQDAGAGGQGGSAGQGGQGGSAGQGGQGGSTAGQGGQGGSTTGQGGSAGHGGQGGATTGQGGSAGHGGSTTGQGGSAGHGGQGGATTGQAGQGGVGGQGTGGSTGGGATGQGTGGQGGSTGGLGAPKAATPDGVTATGGCDCHAARGEGDDSAGLVLGALALAGAAARRRRARTSR